LGVHKEFGADPELKSLYRAYALIAVVGGFLWWIIPLEVALMVLGEPLAAGIVAFVVLLPVIVILLVALYWIPRFYSSIKYVLEEDEIVVERGVWWKTKSVVPYNRVTNVNIYQGPISRHYGIGRLAIQTAGFSGVNSSGHKTAEADIIGIRNFEETKDAVMSFVKGTKPVAVEARAEPVREVNNEVLEELRRIRRAVEK
jgi:membrane protein YdbS with pleckstrin-like domain